LSFRRAAEESAVRTTTTSIGVPRNYNNHRRPRLISSAEDIMSEKPPQDKPESADWNKTPKAPAAVTDPSPEDANITPKTTPQQSL
jgi:hypothetical protein